MAKEPKENYLYLAVAMLSIVGALQTITYQQIATSNKTLQVQIDAVRGEIKADRDLIYSWIRRVEDDIDGHNADPNFHAALTSRISNIEKRMDKNGH